MTFSLGPWVSGLQAALEAGFNDKGLSSLKVDGSEFLVSGQPAVTWVRDAAGKPVKGSLVSSAFDPASKTLTQTFSWGTLAVSYEIKAEVLLANVRLENKGNDTLGSVAFHLMVLEGLGEGRKLGQPTFGVDGPALVTGSGPAGSVVFSNRSPGKPLQLQLAEDADKKSPKKSISVRVMMGGGKVIVDNITSERPLPPGGKETLALELRLGGPGSNTLELAKGLLESYRAANPMILKWDDRRPILRTFIGGGVTIPQAIENMKNPDAVKAPEPDAKFQAQFLEKMKLAVEAGKYSNAQAMILWDLEGGTFPHATTYIGDPRLIRLLNPQMDLIVDEGIKILKEGGLKVGITLRPSRVIYDPAKNTVRHSYADAKDPFVELDGKVEYAKKRWGCQVFYVDTNFFWRPYGPENKWESGQITSDVWKRLQAKYPDTLFIPEFGNICDFPYTAPYTEADMGGYGASPLIRAIWPEAFQSVVIEDADPYENFDRFVVSVRNRNALMTHGSSPNSRNVVAAVRIYQQAGLLDAGVPEAVAKAAPSTLAGLLKSAVLAERFHAARRLLETPQEGAAADLLGRLQDEQEDWLVRHAAARALGVVKYAPAVPVLVDLLKNDKACLQVAAMGALGGQGDAGVAPVMALVESEVLNPAGNFRLVETLGKALGMMKASGQAPALEALFAKIPEGKNIQAMKRAVIFAVAGLKNPASETFFLSVFPEEKLQDAAATGLVLLGSDSGIAKVKAAASEASKAKKDILAKRLNDALKAK